jgi:hypothetical protein
MRWNRRYWFITACRVLTGASAAFVASADRGGGGVLGGCGPNPGRLLGWGPLGESSLLASPGTDGCSHLSVEGSRIFTVLERAPSCNRNQPQPPR